jgi:hypothetical protein
MNQGTEQNKVKKNDIFLALQTFVCVLLFFSTLSLITGCKVYSFTGASIPPEAKTVSIRYIENNADMVEPTLSQELTDALRDRFISQTSLRLIPENGDLQLEGEIRKYEVTPVAIQGNETAALNRLTITIFIKFTNTIDPTKDFESSFSRFEDYQSDQDISQVKQVLIPTINAQLVDDIFNKSVVNW